MTFWLSNTSFNYVSCVIGQRLNSPQTFMMLINFFIILKVDNLSHNELRIRSIFLSHTVFSDYEKVESQKSFNFQTMHAGKSCNMPIRFLQKRVLMSWMNLCSQV